MPVKEEAPATDSQVPSETECCVWIILHQKLSLAAHGVCKEEEALSEARDWFLETAYFKNGERPKSASFDDWFLHEVCLPYLAHLHVDDANINLPDMRSLNSKKVKGMIVDLEEVVDMLREYLKWRKRQKRSKRDFWDEYEQERQRIFSQANKPAFWNGSWWLKGKRVEPPDEERKN
jgi:hypothetical protein